MNTRYKLDRAIENLRDVYSSAKHFGPTHAKLLDDVAAIRTKYLAQAPRWAWGEFRGYERALSDGLYQYSLVFGGFFEDRTFYSTHSSRPDYYGTHGIEPSEWADDGRVTKKGHYWIIRGEPKPFFVK
jgi:hypothetical protein